MSSRRSRMGLVSVLALLVGTGLATGQTPPTPSAVMPVRTAPVPAGTPGLEPAGSLLDRQPAQPIDLNTALRLAGVQNPDLNLARQRVLEAVALRQFAAVQFLPTLNGGASYDNHTGNLQQSNGNILSVNRQAVNVGAGTFAKAAGPPAIPGLVLTGNIGTAVFLYLAARQEVQKRGFDSAAERNQVFLQVCLAYSELTRAEGKYAIALQIRDKAAEVARITSEYARTGQGREADARRAQTFLARRKAEVHAAEGDILARSSYLCRLLNLDPSVRLRPAEAVAVPWSIVPEPIPLPELVATAILRRPELAARRAAIRQGLLALEGAKLLPFSPTILLAFSGTGFGGGSNLVNPVFGNFAPRSDFDTFAFWSLLNMGAGNAALIKIAKAKLGVAQYQELAVLDRVRDEVAEAYAGVHARFAQIGDQEEAVRSGFQGYDLDLERIRQAVPQPGLSVARPIEVLNSLKLLGESLNDYLDAIVDYNRSHFQLYVALGQPPADYLARPVPTGGVALADGSNPRAASMPASADAAPAPPPVPSAGPSPFQPVPPPSAPAPGASLLPIVPEGPR